MGTRFNARLIVSGPKAAMQPFVRKASRAAALAGDQRAFIERAAAALVARLGVEKAVKEHERHEAADPNFFSYTFKFGEGGDLWFTRMRRIGRRYEKKYVFQMKNTDGRDYFPKVSRDWPELEFTLVTACEDEIRSCLIRRGRCREYWLPSARFEAILKKLGYANLEDGSDDYLFWEASSDAMDLAEEKWRPLLGKARGLGASARSPRARRGGTRA